MPIAGPQFTPGGPAGQLANESQSWMDRAHSRDIQDQQMQLQKQQEARQQAQFDVLKPVLEAKSQADIAQAKDTLDAAKGVQDLRMQYLPRVQEGRDAFGQLAGIDDPDERAKAANQWIGKYAPLASLSEYKSEFDTYLHHATDFNLIAQKKATLDSLQQSISNRKAMELDSRAAIEAGKRETQQAIANTRAAASTANAETRANATTTAARTRSPQGMLDNYSQMLADPDTPPSVLKFQEDLLAKHSNFSPEHAPLVQRLLQQKRDAEAKGDTEAAATFDGAINAYIHGKNYVAPEKPEPEKPGLIERIFGSSKPSPIQAPEGYAPPSTAPKVKVDGGEYPLQKMKDAKGNIAPYYFKDGKFFPAPPETLK